MSAITFDTFAFTNELTNSGVSDKQANSIAKAVNKAQLDSEEKIIENVIEKVKHTYRLDDAATKYDIRELELKIELVKRDIKESELMILAKITESKNDTLKSITTLIISSFMAQTGAIFFILKMLGKV
jgi:hypothetical protein